MSELSLLGLPTWVLLFTVLLIVCVIISIVFAGQLFPEEEESDLI